MITIAGIILGSLVVVLSPILIFLFVSYRTSQPKKRGFLDYRLQRGRSLSFSIASLFLDESLPPKTPPPTTPGFRPEHFKSRYRNIEHDFPVTVSIPGEPTVSGTSVVSQVAEY